MPPILFQIIDLGWWDVSILSPSTQNKVTVQHVQFGAWDEYTQTPTKKTEFIQLLSEVQQLQQQRTGLVLVQCP